MQMNLVSLQVKQVIKCQRSGTLQARDVHDTQVQ